MVHCVIKRKGHLEAFDEKKVYASVYAASLSCHHTEQEAEKLAKRLLILVKKWIKKEAQAAFCIEARAIRTFVMQQMKDKDVRLMYKHHTDVC